jgi:hypothetical protein
MDRVFRVPRAWSNRELRAVAPLFSGDVVNVSAWRDEDKEGGHYRQYFTGATSYSLTNFDADKNGFQGVDGEIFLDLEAPLPEALQGRFDVAFNHTTLEHVYDFRTAFRNICAMSRDVVVIVLPWLQPQHTDYGDYWRFSPTAAARMLVDEGFTPARITWNNHRLASVYVFAVGVRNPDKWRGRFEFNVDPASPSFHRLPAPPPGSRALRSSLSLRILQRLGLASRGSH